MKFLTTLLSLCLISRGESTSGAGADARPDAKVRVCVIGAGAAGLSTARYLAQSLDRFDVSVYERTQDVGGTWVYTNRTGLDQHGYPIHSSMYKNLRTNLAKEFMNLPDYPEINANQSCVPHSVILDYLKNYTEHFNLRPLIRFNTKIENIKLDDSDGSDKWKVQVKNLETYEVEENTFDAVVICNGHYSEPYVPKIPGIENFRGKQMHSHSYRVPEIFKGKRVVLLGAASSGIDIALEVSNFASQTFLSHNQPEKVSRKSRNLKFKEVKGIDRFENGKFVLKDNSTLEVDAVIFCTGYNFKYPFLDENDGISVDDNFIYPLYKHMFNAAHPSMSFVGVPTGVVPFPLFHVQSQYIVSVLRGDAKLPPKEIMLEDAKLKSSKKRHAHKVTNQWSYSDELAREGGFPPLPYYYRVASEAWNILKREYPGDFKKFNMMIGEDKISVRIVRHSRV